MKLNIPENLGKGFANLDQLEALFKRLESVAKSGKIQLNGNAFSPVSFTVDTASQLISTVAGPYDISGEGSGTGTIIVNPDDDGAQTFTTLYVAGFSESDTTPSEDISAGADNKFMISVNSDVAEEVELTLLNCDTGANIATEMQTQIRALGGEKALVTVTWDAGTSGTYLITSARTGTSSKVVITRASENDAAEALKIGLTDGGTETAGTGNVSNSKVVTAQELVTLINATATLFTASVNLDGKIVLTTASKGRTSSLVMGNSVLKTIVGLAQNAAAYGGQGLDVDNAENTNYAVFTTLNGATTLTSRVLSATDLTNYGFNLRCETTAATDHVAVLVVKL